MHFFWWHGMAWKEITWLPKWLPTHVDMFIDFQRVVCVSML
jgi:hypothetical protein